MITRRHALGALGAGALTLGIPAIGRTAASSRMALYGPPAGPTITLAYAVASGALAEFASNVTLTVWRNPDELRAGLTSGAIDLSVVPTQAAANLYNRGMGLRLVNVMTNGLLYIMAPEGTATGLKALAKRRVAVPFVNDTPDLILRALLDRHQISMELVAAGNPTEAAQMLLAGRVDAALLSEPVATVVQIRGNEAGKPMARVVDLQQEWGDVTGLGPIVPQAGLAVTSQFTKQHGNRLPALHQALAQATKQVLADPAAAAKLAAGPLEQPAPMLTRSIPHCNLTATPATQARPALEAMFQLMAKADPKILGGKLPDTEFYAL